MMNDERGMMNGVKFPLRISYPANRPYAGSVIEKAGDRVIITYADEVEFRECLRLHRLAQQMEREAETPPGGPQAKPGVVKIEIKQNSF